MKVSFSLLSSSEKRVISDFFKKEEDQPNWDLPETIVYELCHTANTHSVTVWQNHKQWKIQNSYF
jgi:hypothetical protein